MKSWEYPSWFLWFVWLVSFVLVERDYSRYKTNQIDQINQTNQINQRARFLSLQLGYNRPRSLYYMRSTYG